MQYSRRLAIPLLALILIGFNPSVAITQGQLQFGATRAPSIAVDKANRLYLMMSVATSPAVTPHSQIFFSWSRDGGATWDNMPKTRNLSQSPGEAFGPSLSVTRAGKPRAYVAYHDNSTGTTQAYLIKSKKKAKFGRPSNITPHLGGAFFPKTALDSNEGLHIVWGDTDGGGRKVMYLRSEDLGETFTEPVEMSMSTGDAFEPDIAVGPDDAIHIVWEDTRSGISTVMHSVSVDGGSTFSEATEVSEGLAGAFEPKVTVDSSGRVFVVWVEQSAGTRELFLTRSFDGGASFSEPVGIVTGPELDLHKPAIVTFNETVFVAYHDEVRRNAQVYVLRSLDAGESFSGPTTISNADTSRGRGHSAAMTVDLKGRLHIVWIDSSPAGNEEGVLFYSNGNGKKFLPQQLILAVL